MTLEDWNPLYDKIIVQRDAAAEVIGSLAVPDAAKKRQTAGTVLKTGLGRIAADGSKATALVVKPGYRVLFSEFSGMPLDPDEPDIVVLREDELLAYIPGELEEEHEPVDAA